MQLKANLTVCLTVHDSERYIERCIRSLLSQTVEDFEIVAVEDPPYDGTKKILESFKDKRIVYQRNPKPFGICKTRNVCVKLTKTDYIFFTDDDCVVSEDWIEQGLKSLSRSDCAGVEGKTYYVSEEYKPTFSDTVIENKTGGLFMTCNIAYKRRVIERIGGFDERYSLIGDRDLALRAARIGKIHFNSRMVVYHQKTIRTPYQFIRKAQKTSRNLVLLHRKFHASGIPEGDIHTCLWKIVFPLNLVTMIAPPMIMGSFVVHKYRTKEDFALFPYIYPMIVSERLSLWNECAKQRVFLV